MYCTKLLLKEKQCFNFHNCFNW